MSRQRKTFPKKITENPWNLAVGVLACALVFLIPFFPDEKLSRLKLEALEIGVFVMAVVVGWKLIFQSLVGSGPRDLRRLFPIYAIALWFVANIFFWLIAQEKSVATTELRRICLASASYLVFYLSNMPEKWKKRVLVAWSGATTLLAIYGLLQLSGGVGPLMVPKMARAMGTYGNPIFFSAFLVMGLFISLEAYEFIRETAFSLLFKIAILVQLAALGATQTRASWLAVILAMLAGGAIRFGIRRVSFGIWAGMILGLSFFAFQTRKVWQRDQGHLLIWRDTLRMWHEHPITGVGLGAFYSNFPSYAQDDLKSKWPSGKFIVNDAHNEYLQILSETGVVGLTVFLIIPLLFFLRRQWDWISTGVLAIFIQNFFSVDMRFGLSLASCLMAMGLADSHEGEPKVSGRTVFHFILAAVWAFVLLVYVVPRLIRPYRATREVAATPGFFNERLLDPAKSIDELEKLADAYPNEPSVIEKLGYVYAKEIQGTNGAINPVMADKAVAAYKRVIELDPKRMGAANNLANIYYTTGRVDEAIQTWEKALIVNSDFVDIHLNLGKILYSRGQLKNATAHFEKVLKLDPNNAEAIVYLKKMIE